MSAVRKTLLSYVEWMIRRDETGTRKRPLGASQKQTLRDYCKAWNDAEDDPNFAKGYEPDGEKWEPPRSRLRAYRYPEDDRASSSSAMGQSLPDVSESLSSMAPHPGSANRPAQPTSRRTMLVPATLEAAGSVPKSVLTQRHVLPLAGRPMVPPSRMSSRGSSIGIPGFGAIAMPTALGGSHIRSDAQRVWDNEQE